MRQVEIPGGTATFREPKELSPRQKRAIRDAAMAAAPAFERLRVGEVVVEPGSGEDAVAAAKVAAQESDRRNREESLLSKAHWRRLREFRETLIVVSLAGWSLPEPLPTEESIGDLETGLYDALVEAVQGGEATPDFSPSPDKESPTNGSSDSPGPSSDSQADPSTTNLPSGGSPSSTESSGQDA